MSARPMSPKLLHATCVALDGRDGPLGVLLRGPSGAGKSDLALRLIDRGARLVADDQCEVKVEDGAAGSRWIARAPAAIVGVLEVRGLGLMIGMELNVLTLLVPPAVPRVQVPPLDPIPPAPTVTSRLASGTTVEIPLP